MVGRALLAVLLCEFAFIMPLMPKAVAPVIDYRVSDPREPTNGNRRHRRRMKAGVA